MNNLYVYNRKSYKTGFVLTEAELRRIVQTIKEQLAKALPNEPRIKYAITFENGTYATTQDIEQVLSQENSGSLLITELTIDTSVGELDEEKKSASGEEKRYEYEIFARFSNIDSDSVGNSNSMYFFVSGKSRDWAIVTNNILEEKFDKVKFTLIRFQRIVRWIILILLFASIGFIIYTYDFSTNKVDKLTELENLFNQDSLLTIKKHISLEKEIAKYEEFENRNIRYSLYVVFTTLIMLIIISESKFTLKKLYPQYNFCWGDHKQYFEKKTRLANNIFWGVVIAFILGIIVNVITNKI